MPLSAPHFSGLEWEERDDFGFDLGGGGAEFYSAMFWLCDLDKIFNLTEPWFFHLQN